MGKENTYLNLHSDKGKKSILLQILEKGSSAFFITLILLLSLSSCQEKIEWELEMENELRLVVDARITNERRAHEVKLSLPVYEINGEPRPVSGAEVYILRGDQRYDLAEDSLRPGVYLTDPDVQGVVGKLYILYIKVNDYEFWAGAQMEAVTPIRYPGYYRVSEDPELYELYFTGSDAPSFMKLEMDWSEVPGYEDLPVGENHAVVFGYNFSILTVDANEMFASNHDMVRFPSGTSVIITKESLSDGYQEYLRGMLSETTWNGGMFDVKPGDPFTNLSAGAIGYFAATTVVRDTVIFEP